MAAFRSVAQQAPNAGTHLSLHRGSTPSSASHKSDFACLAKPIPRSSTRSHACLLISGSATSSRQQLAARWTVAASASEDVGSVGVEEEKPEENEAGAGGPAAEDKTCAQLLTSNSDVWELDFCSRPIFDDRRKKVWELLICDPERNFQYAEYFPNNKINSVQLKAALQRVLELPSVRPPLKMRFFRAQMATIITKAAQDLPFKTIPSRRCSSLLGWLQERHVSVYPTHPGYDTNAPPLMTYEAGIPQELADALRGEQWAFVMLPLAQVQEEAAATIGGGGFGELLSGATLPGLTLSPEVLIPGVAVFSQRALPLAAWTNGLELAALKADPEMGSLLLETGVNTRWRYANYRRTTTANQEASDWENAKIQAGGVHFLAIQTDPDAPSCSGFWMMREFEASALI